ncbi:MAG: hypothetical protein HYU67_10335 [Flavobacteriia bacterium]|nr:hypothetical protein [Flavobacteriia bacterium]
MFYEKSSFLAIFLTFLIVSCKKNYTCECNETEKITNVYEDGELVYEGYSNTSIITLNINDKKKKAESRCKANELTTTQKNTFGLGTTGGDYTLSFSCKIK